MRRTAVSSSAAQPTSSNRQICSAGGSFAAVRADLNMDICAASWSSVGIGTTSHPSPILPALAMAASTWAPTMIGGRGDCGSGRGASGDIAELPVASGMRDPVFGPEPSDDLDSLGKPAHPLRHRHAEHLVLLGPIAEPNSEQEPAAGDHVQEGAVFRQLDRVVQRQQRHIGSHPQTLGLGGNALMQQRQLREEVKTRRDVVLAGPDRVEAERTNKAYLLQRLGEVAGRIIAHRVLRVQIDAELQGHAPVIPRALSGDGLLCPLHQRAFRLGQRHDRLLGRDCGEQPIVIPLASNSDGFLTSNR